MALNIQAAASRAVAAVNPQTEAMLLSSTGWTSGPGATRIPAYADPVPIWADVQQLTQGDLRMLDGLNIQGLGHRVYLVGRWAGVIRAVGQGGDLMKFGGQTWLVVAILERWATWTAVAIVLQNDAA